MSSAVRLKDRVPYQKSVEGTINGIRSVFAQYRRVQKVVFDVQLPFLYVERLASPEEAAEEPLADSVQKSLHRAIRNGSELQQYQPSGKKPPHEQLFEMFELIAEEGLAVSHIVVGSLLMLRKWIKFSRRRETVFGVPVYAVSEFPDDVIIVCGALSREAEPEDIQHCIKGMLDFEKPGKGTSV